MSAKVVPFPKSIDPPAFDPAKPWHKVAAMLVELFRREGVECSFEEVLADCHETMAQIRRELAERGR